MGIFIRTLAITLLFCIGYFTWTYFSKEGYSPELKITDEAKNFVTQDEKPKDEPKKPENTMQDVRIAFLNSDGGIKFVDRKAKHKTLYTAVGLLLKGPTEDEIKEGAYTEIPPSTKLISVKKNEENGSIIINLSTEFGEGGGTQSIQGRMAQLVRTANLYAGKAPVYLYLDGSKAQYIGGEGVPVLQPINK